MSVDSGSFRDPLSRVHHAHGRVFRSISAAGVADLDAFMESRFAARRVATGDLIATSRPDDPEALALCPDGGRIVEHPRLDLWTYPFEWSFSMLRAAALLQLGLMSDALDEGLIVKDATPYNIQFVGARPVFIDIGSFERYVDGDVWAGYAQFCRMFLYPLMLQSYAGIDHQGLMRANIDGVEPGLADAILRGSRRVRKGVPLHVALLARAERALDDGSSDARADAKAAGMSSTVIKNLVAGLTKLVTSLSWKKADSQWSEYGARSHYVGDALDQKTSFVSEAAQREAETRASGSRHAGTDQSGTRAGMAWDIGCNDGYFTKLIAPWADQVLAIDSDHLVVDMLFRDLQRSVTDTSGSAQKVVPVVANMVDPPPAIGWRNRERPAFLQRNRPDFVIALAVLHHMALSGNVPLDEIVDFFADLGARCVIEFPTRSDVMVKRLLRNKRGGLFDSYDLDRFESELTRRFSVERRLELMGGDRILFEVLPLSV